MPPFAIPPALRQQAKSGKSPDIKNEALAGVMGTQWRPGRSVLIAAQKRRRYMKIIKIIKQNYGIQALGAFRSRRKRWRRWRRRTPSTWVLVFHIFPPKYSTIISFRRRFRQFLLAILLWVYLFVRSAPPHSHSSGPHNLYYVIWCYNITGHAFANFGARIFKFNQMSVKMFTMPFVPASEKQKKNNVWEGKPSTITTRTRNRALPFHLGVEVGASGCACGCVWVGVSTWTLTG